MNGSMRATSAEPAAGHPTLGGNVRHEWLLEADWLTVNHGSFGATPRVVMDAQDKWRRQMEAQPSHFMRRVLPDALRSVVHGSAGWC